MIQTMTGCEVEVSVTATQGVVVTVRGTAQQARPAHAKWDAAGNWVTLIEYADIRHHAGGRIEVTGQSRYLAGKPQVGVAFTPRHF